ncbi:MAG: sulfite exporter TauE/SafE family protein [Bacteroidetes bacterium]|nr:MAG: sulfite exporter TauE/SafE family protein [Bacteroidota bacterium]MBL1143448.1 sulfite exporter TauE/SafE family protein [Bacteroidota bacterium]MCB0802555.1 sulfite exporter TauE/SafE family protein [Flavobacteriales bacterium]NOG56252.1 sulfite exporter TauE/SafE family protein [Bacteroidota bacterium]
MDLSTLLILIVIGLLAGLLSGLIGVGGGIIIVPALVYFLGLSQHMAQGTSLALMLPPIGILAAMNYYKAGELNVKYAIVIALAFIVGGYFGSKISIDVISETLMKKLFGIILLVTAIKILFFSK